jgi:hypothetical protein
MKYQRPWRVIFMIGIALGLTLPITTIAEERAAAFLQATSWPTRERVDIGGRDLYMSCTGTGTPTLCSRRAPGTAPPPGPEFSLR